MAEVEMKFDDSGWKKILSKLGNMKRALEIVKSIARVVAFKEVIQHFRDEKGERGTWPDWSPSYKEYRQRLAGRSATPRARKQASAQKIRLVELDKKLVLTGRLRQNFLPSNIKTKGNDSVVLFNPVEYASQHDQGSPSKRIPQRQFMWMSGHGMELMGKNFVSVWSKEAGL